MDALLVSVAGLLVMHAGRLAGRLAGQVADAVTALRASARRLLFFRHVADNPIAALRQLALSQGRDLQVNHDLP